VAQGHPQGDRQHAIALDTGRGTPDEPVAYRLIHTRCRRRTDIGTGRDLATVHAREPQGLA
jgi:hypothetical protein